MRSNGLLKWLMLPVIALGVRRIRLFPAIGASSPQEAGTTIVRRRGGLSASRGHPNDTVATLVAQVRQFREELEAALSDNRSQQAENDRLRQRERSIEQRIQTALDTSVPTTPGSRNRGERTAAGAEPASGYQRQFEGLGCQGDHADLPIGLASNLAMVRVSAMASAGSNR